MLKLKKSGLKNNMNEDDLDEQIEICEELERERSQYLPKLDDNTKGLIYQKWYGQWYQEIDCKFILLIKYNENNMRMEFINEANLSYENSSKTIDNAYKYATLFIDEEDVIFSGHEPMSSQVVETLISFGNKVRDLAYLEFDTERWIDDFISDKR